MRIALLLIVFVCSLNSALAQKETANWFLTWNSVSVAPAGISNNGLSGSRLATMFTSTSVSDSAGNLLFASDGGRVIDKNLQDMPSLPANVNFTNGLKVLAVKIPGTTKYYLFYSTLNSSAQNSPGSIFYSLVDMSLNAGKGDLVFREKLLANDVSFGFSLAQAGGSEDAWLVTHRSATDTFLCYKVTAAGLSEEPVISKAGTNVTTIEYLFQDLKTSHNGQMIAGIAYRDYSGYFAFTYQFIETFYFNGETGKLSNKLRSTRVGTGYFQGYQSLEFSPDNRLLYFGNMQRIYGLQPCGFGSGDITQYNLCYADSVKFTRYATIVAFKSAWCNPGASWGRIQMGADKRIYTVYTGNTVSAINNPNRIGTQVNFQFNAHSLSNSNSGSVSVPGFYHGLMQKAVINNIVYEGGCFPAPTSFRVTNDTITNIQWNFGDPASAGNTSSERTPAHQFSGPGIYTVTATLFNSLQQPLETVTELVEIKDPGKRLLHAYPRDTTFCTGQSLKIKLAVINGIFVWSRKDDFNMNDHYRTADSVELESAGTYYVQMRQNDCNGCVMTDSITIRLLPVPYVNLGYDRELCTGDSLTLFAEGPPASNVWSTGATTPSIQVKAGGVYWVRSEYNNNGCPRTDTVVIKAVPGVNFSLPPDTTLCNNQTLLLNPGVAGAWYTWQNGSSASTFEVTGPGKYWVRIMNNNYCWRSDTINVSYINAQQVYLGNDTALCLGDSLLLSGNVPNAGYLWSNGSTAPFIKVKESGQYWIKVNNGNCVVTDTIGVLFSPPPLLNLGKDTVLCAGQKMVLRAQTAGANYRWQDGSTADSFVVTQPGNFWVSVERGGCIVTDTISILYKPLPGVSLGPDLALCAGTELFLTPAGSGIQAYRWQNGATEITQLIRTAGTYWVEVLGTNGCYNRDSILVAHASLPQFTLGRDTTLCTGQTLRYQFSGAGASYLWNNASTSNALSITSPGLYWLQVTENGCSKRDSIHVFFKAAPVVDLGSDTTLCEGTSKVLNAFFPGAQLLWSDGSQSSSLTVSQPGTYRVTASLAGCSFSDTIQIRYTLLPRFTLGPDLVLCKGQSIKLQPQLGTESRLWQDGSTQPTYTVTKSGMYTLALTNVCGTKTDAVQVSDGYCALLMPDAFTPNRDGINDIFKVKYPQFIKTFQFTIFNRWGEIVYSSTDPSKGWDGTLNGIVQPTGNFVWQITLVDLDGKSERHTGSVFLVR